MDKYVYKFPRQSDDDVIMSIEASEEISKRAGFTALGFYMNMAYEYGYNKPFSMSYDEIARRCDCSRTTAVRMIKRLCNLGWAIKERDTADDGGSMANWYKVLLVKNRKIRYI